METVVSDLPDCETLILEREDAVLRITLNRPESRNALSGEMVAELGAVTATVRDDRSVRAIVLRGAGGIFCAGGDIKGFRRLFQGEDGAPMGRDEIAAQNRSFGSFLTALNEIPQTVVMLVEGAAMGGGMGLICASDVAIVQAGAKLSLTETSLGLPPAQIAPFVAQRVGLTQARRLMLTGARLDGNDAVALGLAHFAARDASHMDELAAEVLARVGRCAPGANAATKDILMSSLRMPLVETLDRAAAHFADCMRSDEGREGVSAFLEKRRPAWAGSGG
jgi:isohexenylglutaconyl-CoA hydratase